MKHLLWALGLILTVVLGGCSSGDDEPGSGNAKAKGNVEIDGHKANLKYAYVTNTGRYDNKGYYFSDIDIIKYLDKDWEDINVNITILFIDTYGGIPTYAEIIFKPNKRATKGSFTYYYIDDLHHYASYSFDGKMAKVDAKEVSFRIYDETYDKYLGYCTGSFSVEGEPKDITYLYNRAEEGDDYGIEQRSLTPTVVSDPSQIAFLKSLVSKRNKK